MPDRSCTLPECGKKEFARGWCHMHWNRWRRHGDPLAVRQIQGDTKARILSRVQVAPNGCWVWQGQRNAEGYGRLLFRGRKDYAHRAAYEVFVGPIPVGLTVDHVCHSNDLGCHTGPCPHRPCVNPEHLEPVTHTENIRRAFARKRAATA